MMNIVSQTLSQDNFGFNFPSSHYKGNSRPIKSLMCSSRARKYRMCGPAPSIDGYCGHLPYPKLPFNPIPSTPPTIPDYRKK